MDVLWKTWPTTAFTWSSPILPIFFDRLDDGWSDTDIEHSKQYADVRGRLAHRMRFDPQAFHVTYRRLVAVRSEARRLPAVVCRSAPLSLPQLPSRKLGSSPGDLRMALHEEGASSRLSRLAISSGTEGTVAKTDIIARLNGRHIPGFRLQFEVILCAPEAARGALVDNWLEA